MVACPALLASATFANTLLNGFVYDDAWILGRMGSLSRESMGTFLTSLRGLTYLVHRFDASIWGSWAPGFHLTNVSLHVLATALTVCASKAITRSNLASFLCGALFAVHPVHVETVASFANRKDILAMIFAMLTLILWVAAGHSWLRYAGSLVCLALGLFSKEVAVIGLVPVLFVADLLPGYGHAHAWKPRLRRAVLRCLPFLILGVIGAVSLVLNWSTFSTLPELYHESNGQMTNYGHILLTMSGSIGEVARLLVWPASLSADYPIHAQQRITDPRVLVGLLLVATWVCGIALLAKRMPAAALAAAWIPLTYLPTSNLVPLSKFMLAERYLYVPSFGACLLAALGVEKAMRALQERGHRWRLAGLVVLAAIAIVGGGVRASLQNLNWRDNSTLWSSVLSSGIETRRAHHNLGTELIRQGKPQDGIGHLYAASRLHPCTVQILHLARALMNAGRSAEADSLCRRILRFEPSNADARYLLATIPRRNHDIPQGGDTSRR